MELLNIVELVSGLRFLEKKVAITLMYSGLNITQFKVLNIIEDSNSMTVSELSKYLHVTRASTSTMVNELINTETLAALENPNDRRSFYVILTRRGRERLDVARKDLSVMQANFSANYSAEEIQQINKFSDSMHWEHLRDI